MPAPKVAVLADSVAPLMVTAPATTSMPPPEPAELPDRMQPSITLRMPVGAKFQIPPPAPAELPDRVQPLTVNGPATVPLLEKETKLAIPPPSPPFSARLPES